MPAVLEGDLLGRRAAVLSLAALLLLAALGVLAVPAHAADDSNAGPLTQVPTVSAQGLSSALSTLSQGTNNTALQQLIAEFQSQMNSGDYSGAASTLIQLQGMSGNQTSGDSQSLNALLQSLSVDSKGASVNANTLSGLLNTKPGSQAGASGESPQTLSVDMQSLANLMQYVNATMASALLQNSDLLSPGASGLTTPGGPIAAQGPSSLPGLSIPSIGAPSLSIGSPSAGLPAIPLSAFAIPLLVAVAAVALFLSRGRGIRLGGAQTLPGMAPSRKGGDETGPVPTDPRGRIEFYFGKAVNLMARRGVHKLESETHREFSSKCESTPEQPHVSTISSLYEKAKFSGQDVGSPDANLAASSFSAMEKEER